MLAWYNVNEFTSSKEMRGTLSSLSVNQLIAFRTLLFIKKVIKCEVPKYLSDNVRFNRDSQFGTLRNANDFELIWASTAFGQNSLFYWGNQMYNNLPKEVKVQNLKENWRSMLSMSIKLILSMKCKL